MAEGKEMLIVVSKVKEAVKAAEIRSGEEFIDALNAQVHMIIAHAVARAKANGRGTLKAEDI